MEDLLKYVLFIQNQ